MKKEASPLFEDPLPLPTDSRISHRLNDIFAGRAVQQITDPQFQQFSPIGELSLVTPTTNLVERFKQKELETLQAPQNRLANLKRSIGHLLFRNNYPPKLAIVPLPRPPEPKLHKPSVPNDRPRHLRLL